MTVSIITIQNLKVNVFNILTICIYMYVISISVELLNKLLHPEVECDIPRECDLEESFSMLEIEAGEEVDIEQTNDKVKYSTRINIFLFQIV